MWQAEILLNGCALVVESEPALHVERIDSLPELEHLADGWNRLGPQSPFSLTPGPWPGGVTTSSNQASSSRSRCAMQMAR